MDNNLLAYQAPADLLAGRVILVTGAGDGIGKAVAQAYAASGATVILLGRTVSKLEQVYDAIVAAGHPEPAIMPLDLATTDYEVYAALADSIGNDFGRLDGVLHNASILGQRTAVIDIKPTVWQQVLDVNITATFLLTKALLPLLQQAPDAALLFTSSSVGHKGRAYWGAYAVSKFATEGLMQVLADELENISNIRVNSINPGATNSAMRRTAYPGENPAINLNPQDLVAAYLYLMGPESKALYGQAVNIQPPRG